RVQRRVGALQPQRGRDHLKRKPVILGRRRVRGRFSHISEYVTRGKLPSLEDRLTGAVLQEAAHPRLLVLGGEQRREVQPLDLQASAQINLQAAVHRLLGGAQRERRPRRVLGDHVLRGL